LKLADVPPRTIAIAAAVVIGVGAVVYACGACGKSGGVPTSPTDPSALEEGGATDAAARQPPPRRRELASWEAAADGGDVEDLAALATSEGAAGLIEAANEDAELRPTAVRAMAYARGWAQLPYLARVASDKDDDLARAALDSVLELAVRPRRAEDPEDEGELRDGCERLAALAKDANKARARRVASLRALRMMPCPPIDGGLPTDLDAR
jgi:hypothetical protein